MRSTRFRTLAALALAVLTGCASAPRASQDPLPSWNGGEAKSAVVDFVRQVADEDSPTYVAPSERVAVFDNDGTLWSEQPAYFQLLFALDRVREMAPDHPEWRDAEPFRSAIAGDMKGVAATGKEGLLKIVAASHADTTADAYAASVRAWLDTAKHPTKGVRYDELVYQPMLELLDYLCARGFKTYIVSGGGIDFMRVFVEDVYGVPPEQVVGSQLDAAFEMRAGVPTIVKGGKPVFVDDEAGKPVGIYRHIGRRPILAAGNSDGDLQMLQYTTIPRDRAERAPRLGILIRHTDARREWAYDRDSAIGRLDEALDGAPRRGWVVVDMARDWNRVYPGAVN